MTQQSHRIVLSLSTVSAACLTVSLSLPRALEPGLPLNALFPHANAFRVPFAISVALAVWLCVYLLRHWRPIGWHLRVVAAMPTALLIGAAVTLYWRT